jgi:hypothetical protein
VSLELDGDGLKFEEKGANREAKFEFVAQVTDSKGKISGVARDAVQVRLPAEKAEKIKAGGIFYSTGFQLKPGSYKMKLVVRDNLTGKLGSFEQPINVPGINLKRLGSSSIVLGSQLASMRESDSAVTHQGSMRRFQEMGMGYDPLVIGNRRVVPSIGNVFVARQTVYVYFQVYGAAEDSTTQKPCIETDMVLLRENKKILETQPTYVQDWIQAGGFGRFFGAGRAAGGGGPRPDFAGRGGRGDFGGMRGMPPMASMEPRKGEAAVAISLPLRNLKKGSYILQIHLRDAIADANQFQRVPLVIK